MHRSRIGARHSTPLAVIAIVAIPVASVSLAALIAGGAASAEGGSIVPVLMAVVGALVGVGSPPIIRSVVDGVVTATAAVIDYVSASPTAAVPGPPRRLAPALVPVPVSRNPRSSLRRRGPPAGRV